MACTSFAINKVAFGKTVASPSNNRVPSKWILSQPSPCARSTHKSLIRSSFTGNQSFQIKQNKISAGKNQFRVFAKDSSDDTETKYETFEIVLEKPLKVKFGRGNDGGAYVIQVASDPNYKQFTVGDKIKRVSASFGDDIWAAENYGQVMFAMKTRSGEVFLEMEKRNGDMAAFEVLEKKSGFKTERNSGNYGSGTMEVQMKNYNTRQELEQQRTELFNEALGLFKEKKYNEALVIFENVVGLEPKGFIGDDMSKTTRIFRVAQYNVACCYSMINQNDAGLEALLSCMKSGFDDYKMIREDKNLAFIREDERFSKMINRFDEPFINENAMKAFKNLFGGKK
eukprot:CAMPEP_0196592878 /NCGR_PEP_ID=MMETSP1081-20130531/74099_1 /TAXON_ID=36882 /ORGANISM="Pyramimonas amylifera, Strain CCMP720" /LENGTH=340 /DNA_ID=CAMNT_0041916695 /DNA_START=91 /DNA_END=1113 /DNA_ORIENTATION=+